MRRKKGARPLKWSVFYAMIAFAIVIIFALWLAQITLLGSFHFWNIKNTMADNAYRLSLEIGEDGFEERIEQIAEEGQACVVLYRIDNDTATVIYDYKESPSCVVHHMDSAIVCEISAHATENGDVLQLRMSDLMKSLGHEETSKYETDRLLTTYVVIEDGAKYMLFLDAAIFPVESTVTTLRYQLIYISVALLILASVLSFVLSRYIASPIEKITEHSKGLPRGEYKPDKNDRTYHEIEELSDTLSHAADEISKVERLQKELIANISHDLRTPLTMIIGYGEVMRDIESENTPENMQVIIDEASRLSVLVNDLLEISRIQGGNAQRKDEVFDFSVAVRETAERYRRLKENCGFTFIESVENGIIVKADRGKLLQVVYNLINNAVNYSGDSREVILRLYQKAGKMRFEVIDHGIGIPSEDLESVWERYYKVDKQHKRSVMGSGLGLSIVREILTLHGARYGVSSKVGVGSTFWFELPVYDPRTDHLLLD